MELGVLQDASERRKIRDESQQIKYPYDPRGSLQDSTNQRKNLTNVNVQSVPSCFLGLREAARWLELRKLPLPLQHWFFTFLQLTDKIGESQCSLFPRSWQAECPGSSAVTSFTVQGWAQPLAGEQDPAFGYHTSTPELIDPRAAFGRLHPPLWCSRSAQTPLGLAEVWPGCTHSFGGQGL